MLEAKLPMKVGNGSWKSVAGMETFRSCIYASCSTTELYPDVQVEWTKVNLHLDTSLEDDRSWYPFFEGKGSTFMAASESMGACTATPG